MSWFLAIAIIPTVAKVPQPVMKVQVLWSQHDFRSCCSTTTALLVFLGRILEAFEIGDFLALTLCDLTWKLLR